MPRLQDLQDGGFEIIRRCMPCRLNLGLLRVFPIIVKPHRVPTTIEELQRWIGQGSRYVEWRLTQGRTEPAKHDGFRVRSGDDESGDGNA